MPVDVTNFVKMKLLDLRPEMISRIMEMIVLSSDLDMAFYLRLVCSKLQDTIRYRLKLLPNDVQRDSMTRSFLQSATPACSIS